MSFLNGTNVDNLARNYNRKIDKRIDSAITSNDNLINRGASQMRSGPTGYDGLILKNIKSNDYATFGFLSTNLITGP